MADGSSDPIQLSAVFKYDREDPYAVRIDFPSDGIEWVFARDLLKFGLAHTVIGIGDVHVWSAGRSTFIHLASADGRVTLKVETKRVQDFLKKTATLVPYEREEMNFDSELRALLS